MISGASNSSVFSAFSIQLRWFWMRRSTLLLPRHDHLATTDIAAHALHLIFVSSVTPVRPGRQGFLFCSDFRHESLLLGLWALHSCYLGFLFGWSVFFFLWRHISNVFIGFAWRWEWEWVLRKALLRGRPVGHVANRLIGNSVRRYGSIDDGLNSSFSAGDLGIASALPPLLMSSLTGRVQVC